MYLSNRLNARAAGLRLRLALACLIALVVSSLPVVAGTAGGTALAAPAPAISVSRSQGQPGTMVRVRGFHFDVTAAVTVSLGGTAVATATTTASGFFAATFTVPQLPPGPYTLSAASAGGLSSGVTFVVTQRPPPHLSLSPHRALPGSTLTVRGTRFAAGESVAVTLAGTVVTTTATDRGAIMVTTTVPLLSPGAYPVTALDATSGLSATAFVQVLAPAVPRLHLSSDDAPAGTTIAVKGHNFAPSEAVTLTLGTTVLTTTVADAHGLFATSFVVPTLPSGAYTVTAAGPPGAPVASAPFTVRPLPAPRLIISRLTATPGQTIRVRGLHFGASETVQLSLASTVVATATTTSGGSFKTSFVVPPLAPGLTTFMAVGTTSGISLTAAFQVLAPPPPAFGLSRRAAFPGQVIVAQGKHFGAAQLVTISMPVGGSALTLATVTTTVSGSFNTTFTVPAAPLGRYSVTALAVSSAISASFPLAVVAPPAPTLALWRHMGIAGAIVPARGFHFGANELVTIDIGATQVATATTTRHGTFFTRFTVPCCQPVPTRWLLKALPAASAPRRSSSSIQRLLAPSAAL